MMLCRGLERLQVYSDFLAKPHAYGRFSRLAPESFSVSSVLAFLRSSKYDWLMHGRSHTFVSYFKKPWGLLARFLKMPYTLISAQISYKRNFWRQNAEHSNISLPLASVR